MNDLRHVSKEILVDFVQMIYYSRQFARHADPGIVIQINYDTDEIVISHDGESYNHREVYDFLGREVIILFYFFSFSFMVVKLFLFC